MKQNPDSGGIARYHNLRFRSAWVYRINKNITRYSTIKEHLCLFYLSRNT